MVGKKWGTHRKGGSGGSDTIDSITMVKLTKIYTRSGDDGSTGLGTGARVPKDDPRVSAYGDVDETNAVLGVAILHAPPETQPLLRSIQHDLFDLGADLCIPSTPEADPSTQLRITQSQIDRLERAIDDCNDKLTPLTSFVLPGGSSAASHLHVARTVARRAERSIVTLIHHDPDHTNPLALTYINRLSDLLFVLARVANDDGRADVLWEPGKTRDQDKDPR